MDDIKSDLDQIRNSLGPYCMNECKAKCCKMGKLLLQTNEEFETIVPQEKVEEYLNEGILEQNTETKNIHFNHEKVGGCQHLNGVMCSIYTNKHKPKICSDFPIFKVGNYIMTSSFCPAIENNILTDDLKKVAKKHNLKLM